MKAIKYIAGLAIALSVFTACQKTTYEDLSLVATAEDPDQLSVLFEITQDNSGLVTITPNGAGAVKYDVYYGHGAATPAVVMAGKNTTHTYPEGVYTVKIIAYNVVGKTKEFTQQLTVSFRAPENLDVITTIDPGNNFQLNVSASALYETNFRVFFGDVPNEVGTVFLEGQTVNHIYANVGTYTVRVVAYSGGAATTQVTRSITIVDPLLLPITFESATVNYAFTNFDGGNVTVINNPQSSGINTSAKVARMVKNAGQPWGGSFITLSSPIDFNTGKIFRMKVWSPRVGAKVLLKVENSANTAQNYEKEVLTTVANGWEDMVFDYQAVNTTNSYNRIVLIFDNGTMGDGTANFTFLMDDIRLVSSLPLSLPLDFESTATNYNWFDFDGGAVTTINNPHINGINTSARVGRMVKNAGQPWGGSFLTLSLPMDFSNKIFRMKVWSPRAGAKVLLKVENSANSAQNFEKEVVMTVANAWEDLVFDYAAINTGNSYNRIVLIFDNGTPGDGSSNFTFYFDDIRLVNTVPITLPLNFEHPVTYPWTNFDGGDVTVINNPDASGINTSAKVARMIKNAGQTWGGSFLTLAGPIDFSVNKTFKMKVWSPRVGAKVLLKVENSANPGQNYEKEVLTTVANGWEELTFDYTAINTANPYNRIVIIFDNGTMGDGTANFTFFFDDIKLV